MTRLFVIVAFCAVAASAATNDSCDIGVTPAATLLLPYFEVAVANPPATARTTLFTVVNTSPEPHVARVTLWTDYAYPVLTFNLALTGFDAQSINLYDLLGPQGMQLPPAAWCGLDPVPVPNAVADDVRSALTIGTVAGCGQAHVGSTHAAAIGYATIDVVSSCGTLLPNNPAYYDGLLNDNVLIGDWEIIDPDAVTGNYAGGSPLVHIRAVEPSTIPYTFYDRFTTKDRRQPLPAVFAARFIGYTAGMRTNFLIWREGQLGANATCADYVKNARYIFDFKFNGDSPDLVRFDEHENPTMRMQCPHIPTCQGATTPLPAASSTSIDSFLFPPLATSGDVAGWMYMNLTDTNMKINGRLRASQDWVVVSMYAQGRYSVAFDAGAIVNGCAPLKKRGGTIGP